MPRHLFIPDFYLHTGMDAEDERKGTHFTPETPGYLDAVYSDQTLVTQFIEYNGWPWPTSSSTAPSLMLRMLQDLHVHDGMTVLEVGTGTGYNAGLLSQRLGADRVTSIDIDPELVALAGPRLQEAGFHPTLAVGDGRNGFPEGAPFDRLIATVAFDQIPLNWVQQVKPKGVIVCDLRHGGAPWSGALAKLEVGGDQTASGNLLACPVGFMSARTQVGTPGTSSAVSIDKTTCHGRETRVGGSSAMSPGLALSIWQRIPNLVVYPGEDTFTIVSGDSWAEVSLHEPTQVTYSGPEDLWAVVEETHAWWRASGQPEVQRYGITVTPDRQWVWLDTPDRPVAV
ncbi:methyltransferase domain-containing protein [Nonomuraea sp. NPDC059007]|uniref:methyltransferase domain-containing protein n=1 Tax=Nonomuraea sp. NPDC059007 TaxID=3346692 RepID=UPI0036C4EA9F